MGDGVEAVVSTDREAKPIARAADDLTNRRRFESRDVGHGLRWRRIAERLLDEVFGEDCPVSRGVGEGECLIEHRNEVVVDRKRAYQTDGVVALGSIDQRTRWDFDLQVVGALRCAAGSDVLGDQRVDPASGPRPRRRPVAVPTAGASSEQLGGRPDEVLHIVGTEVVAHVQRPPTDGAGDLPEVVCVQINGARRVAVRKASHHRRYGWCVRQW